MGLNNISKIEDYRDKKSSIKKQFNKGVIKVSSFENFKNRKIDKQTEIDKEIKTVCANCKNLLDATEYYGGGKYDKENGEYFFCKESVLDDEGYTFINSTTGNRSRSIIYSFLSDGYAEGKNVLVDEPASIYEKCIEINKGECIDFEEKVNTSFLKKIINKLLNK